MKITINISDNFADIVKKHSEKELSAIFQTALIRIESDEDMGPDKLDIINSKLDKILKKMGVEEKNPIEIYDNVSDIGSPDSSGLDFSTLLDSATEDPGKEQAPPNLKGLKDFLKGN